MTPKNRTLEGKNWTLGGRGGKCFTYDTKTCANLTTYSRKPENYNGTIIFDRESSNDP